MTAPTYFNEFPVNVADLNVLFDGFTARSSPYVLYTNNFTNNLRNKLFNTLVKKVRVYHTYDENDPFGNWNVEINSNTISQFGTIDNNVSIIDDI